MNPVLNLLQISDSMFPIGSFAHSFGLETLVSKERVTKNNFREFIESMLRNQVGPCDMVFMLNSHNNMNKAEKFSNMFGCHKTVPAFFSASLKMGKRLLQVSEKLTQSTYMKRLCEKNIHHPIAFGVVTKELNITSELAAITYLYNWAANMTSAAIRLIPLGHDTSQQVLHEIKGSIISVYEENKDKTVDEAWQYSLETDIAGLEHNKLYTKLFLS